jgi:hypothetical protein
MRILCLLFWLPLSLPASAQDDEKNRDILEHIAENVTEDADISELTEQLTAFRNRPINLNKTHSQELKALGLLSPIQIGNFFRYLSKNKLIDVLELQAIPSFDIETINRILPFVTLSDFQHYDNLNPNKLIYNSNHDLTIRYTRLLQQQKGFKNLPGSRYLGSPEKLLLKYRYNFQNLISAALVMEKDAGEHIFNRKSITDHLSANISFVKLGKFKKIVIGDYSMQFGQGLTLWSGFAYGKGPDVTSVATRDVGLKAYTSANESAFFRGIASTFELRKNIHISPFISIRKLDASLKADIEGKFTLSNINISGLHRTQTELKNQKSLEQRVYGGVIQYSSNNLGVGIIGYESDYQHEFITGSQQYNKYGFVGKKLKNTGIHYNYTFQNIYIYGELAHSIDSGYAIINGAMASLSAKLSAVMLHRNYSKDYHNFFSKSIGEGSETNNERGWYAGLNYSFSRNLAWSMYGDYFVFPWLKYRINSPSKGHEILSRLSYTVGKTFKAAIRLKTEQKQQNPDAGSPHKELVNVTKQNYRLEWNWKINQKFNFQQRSEIIYYQKDIKTKETGYMIYQDLDYTPLSSKISANFRFAFFNTPSYNSRIYAYENDVLHGAGSAVYAGKGIRTFVNTRYKILKNIDIWTRLALFLYPSSVTIGSGLDQIAGNKKSEVKLQIRYQL